VWQFKLAQMHYNIGVLTYLLTYLMLRFAILCEMQSLTVCFEFVVQL